MRPDNAIRVRHMIEAAWTVQGFVEGRSRGAFDSDLMLQFALVRAIEIIGEAASRVSAETRSATPAVPWAAIVAMRNRLMHAYFSIDPAIVWKSATEEVPALLLILRTVLPEDQD